MKMNVVLFGALFLLLGSYPTVFAQTPSPTPGIIIPSMPDSVVLPQLSPTPAPTPANVSVAEPAAPPKWAQDIIVTAQKLPVIGPLVGKAMLYAGIVSSISTALVACLLAILSALSGVSNIAGLAGIAEKLQLFKNGKIMYYLSYLSMFNAKKPDAKT